MRKKDIINKIKKENDWLNGTYDYLDGDVLAREIAETDNFNLHEYKTIEKIFKDLKAGYTGLHKYNNLIFANHWSYGCFVYKIIDNKLVRFEHLTLSCFDLGKFADFVYRVIPATKEQLIRLTY